MLPRLPNRIDPPPVMGVLLLLIVYGAAMLALGCLLAQMIGGCIL